MDEQVIRRLKRFSLRQMAGYLRKRMRGQAEPTILLAHGETPIDFVRWVHGKYPRLRQKIAAATARILREELAAKKDLGVAFWLLRLVADIAPRSCKQVVLALALENDDRFRQRLEVGFGIDAMATIHAQAMNVGRSFHFEHEPRFREQLVRDLEDGHCPYLAYGGLARLGVRFAVEYFPQVLKAAMRTEQAESELRKTLLIIVGRWKRSRVLYRIARAVRAMEPQYQNLFERASARPECLRRAWEASTRTPG